MKKTRFLIAIEGNIASGKSSVIEYLKKKVSESKELNIELSPLKKKQKCEKAILASSQNHMTNNEIIVNSNNNTNLHMLAKDVKDVHNSIFNVEKTSFFQQSDVNLKVINEPVDLWRNLNGNNLLELMYKDPKRWAFAFHSYVQLTMLQNHLELANDSNLSFNNLNEKCFSINIMERSIFSAKYCFVENLYKANLFKPVEYEILDKWFNFMTSSHDCGLDIIFYLRTNPETCLKRLNQRARTEETNRVSIEYLQQLHDFHEEWLINDSENMASATTSSSPSTTKTSGKKFYRPPSVIVIDANKKLDEVYEIIENATKNAILEIANN